MHVKVLKRGTGELGTDSCVIQCEAARLSQPVEALRSALRPPSCTFKATSGYDVTSHIKVTSPIQPLKVQGNGFKTHDSCSGNCNCTALLPARHHNTELVLCAGPLLSALAQLRSGRRDTERS